RLDEEPLRDLRLVRLQELDRDAATEAQVAGEVDGAHAALADHLDHLVLVDANAGVWRGARGVDGGRCALALITHARATGARHRRRHRRALGARRGTDRGILGGTVAAVGEW